ncbi:bile acid:sodium symporter family protein [Microvirga massiliensis]|uniref:bile acid:sodium symporter family protein n=1 Tax=Microvirga massiliensis TaxID=1033741 RepID=UPI000AF8886B|nr:bile acid:sodium symporter [Microvirga massiliensis]
MTLDDMIGPLVAVTLIELMVTTGLGVRFADVMDAASDWRLVARAGLANYVGVPATAVLLLLLLDPDPMVSAGVLILAVCPGAPYGPPLTAIAGGTTAISVGLMVILAGSSVFVAPVVLSLLPPFTSRGGDLHVDAIGMLGVMLATQLLPLCCGLAVNRWLPDLAARLLRPAIAISKVLNAATLAVILTSQFPRLLGVRFIGVVGMLVLLAVSLLIGWFSGGERDEDRRALALTTAIRNVGLGVEVTAGAFAGTSAVTAVLAYGLIQLLGSFLMALWWRRGPARAAVR